MAKPFLSTLGLVSAFLLLSNVASAATVCVNPGGTGGCFAQVAAALAAAASGDTVTIAAGTYHESGLAINTGVTVVGSGVGATIIDGTSTHAANVAVFQVVGSAIPVTIAQLTITGGYRGVDAGQCGNEVTLDHVRLYGNGPGSGAGAFNHCNTLRVLHSTIENNHASVADHAGCDFGWGGTGGAIASLCGGGWNVIRYSTIAGNSATFVGGGLAVNDGRTLIEHSTISGNWASSTDVNSAVDASVGGGALWISGGFPQITIRFSTITGNSAPNGTGGGIWGGQGDPASSFLTLESSILDSNTSTGAGNCAGWKADQVTSLGFNVVSDTSCVIAATGDLLSTGATLGLLQNNGGPTSTHALLPGSPAIGHSTACGVSGSPANVAVLLGFPELVTDDQRGTLRPVGACDSGAFERVAPPADTTAPVITLPLFYRIEATSPAGFPNVTWTATALDAVDGSTPVTCTPASGSRFPRGFTRVRCSSTDSSGNIGSGSFPVWIVDTQPPVLALPGDIEVDATSTSGTRVWFAATATDVATGGQPVQCNPETGSLFPEGVTVVRCSSVDYAGNRATGSFRVVVRSAVAQLNDFNRLITSLSLPSNIEADLHQDVNAVIRVAGGSGQIASAPDTSRALGLVVTVHWKDLSERRRETAAFLLDRISDKVKRLSGTRIPRAKANILLAELENLERLFRRRRPMGQRS